MRESPNDTFLRTHAVSKQCIPADTFSKSSSEKWEIIHIRNKESIKKRKNNKNFYLIDLKDNNLFKIIGNIFHSVYLYVSKMNDSNDTKDRGKELELFFTINYSHHS